MLKNVLIAEDHESTSLSVRKTLADAGITSTDYVFYCDDALARIQKRLTEEEPYDLLITDLYFEEDECKQKLATGADLIKAAKQIQPDLKVLVFSAETKAAVIESLFDDLNIDGYVRKARHDAQELRFAFENIARNRRHYPPHLRQLVRQKNSYDFTEFDITIISLLSQGMLQKDIPEYLQQNKIKPCGLSSVEKHLNKMKEVLDFTKNEQLVAFCKDMGII